MNLEPLTVNCLGKYFYSRKSNALDPCTCNLQLTPCLSCFKESLQGVIAKKESWQEFIASSHCKESLQGFIARSHCKARSHESHSKLQGQVAGRRLDCWNRKDPELLFSRFLAFSIMLIPSAAAAQDDFLSGLPVRAGMASLEKPAAWADEGSSASRRCTELSASCKCKGPSARTLLQRRQHHHERSMPQGVVHGMSAPRAVLPVGAKKTTCVKQNKRSRLLFENSFNHLSQATL